MTLAQCALASTLKMENLKIGGWNCIFWADESEQGRFKYN